MRITTWNVNSLSARLPRVEEWLERMQPDVVCMQETKLADDAFPGEAFEAMGYEWTHHGQGQWNGVAIISKVGLDDVTVDFIDDEDPYEEARIVWATCGGVRLASIYVPNGREVDHEHYHYKLEWLGRLRGHLDRHCDPATPTLLLGDFNIAPRDIDVWDTKAFAGKTHVTDRERNALTEIKDWGLTDLFENSYGETTGMFTYYDYTAGRFHKRQGIRIDLLLGTSSIVDAVQGLMIDRSGRKKFDGHVPSDHIPTYVDLAL